MPSEHSFDVKSEAEEYNGVEKSEQKFDENIGERVKLRTQKADDKTDEAENDDEKPDNANMSELESEESVVQRRKQKGQGLKILTPQQMLSRLTISLAQLKAGNDSKNLKNEIRQLLYSLYRSKKLRKTIYKHLMKATI